MFSSDQKKFNHISFQNKSFIVKQATENKPEVSKTSQTYTLENGKRDH